MRIRNLLLVFPEYYLIGATIYYWVLTASVFNPVAIVLLLILIYQVLAGKMIPGLVIAALFLLGNAYLVLALLSELSEFPQANERYYQLLTVGSVFLGFNIIAAAVMFWKYLPGKQVPAEK